MDSQVSEDNGTKSKLGRKPVASLTQWTEFGQAPGDGERTEKPGMLRSMGLQRVGYD